MLRLLWLDDWAVWEKSEKSVKLRRIEPVIQGPEMGLKESGHANWRKGVSMPGLALQGCEAFLPQAAA